MSNKNNIQLHDVNLHEAVKRYEQNVSQCRLI